jgi:hypothetical protein
LFERRPDPPDGEDGAGLGRDGAGEDIEGEEGVEGADREAGGDE